MNVIIASYVVYNEVSLRHIDISHCSQPTPANRLCFRLGVIIFDLYDYSTCTHYYISIWIIHAARLCERRVRASRPKLRSGSYIARSIKMSINPRRYRCLLLLLALSFQLLPCILFPLLSVIWFIFSSIFFSLGATFAGDDAARPVPGKRLVDLDLVENTPRSSLVVLHRDTSLFDDSTFFAVSIRALFGPQLKIKLFKNW